MIKERMPKMLGIKKKYFSENPSFKKGLSNINTNKTISVSDTEIKKEAKS
jgi:hypothetical protein